MWLKKDGRNRTRFRDARSHAQRLTFLDFLLGGGSRGEAEAARRVSGDFTIGSASDVPVGREGCWGWFGCMRGLLLYIFNRVFNILIIYLLTSETRGKDATRKF
jgi:hypothetical protein